MGFVLLFLLLILLFLGYIIIKDKDIYPILLYFFVAINIIVLTLAIYFISYVKYSDVIDMGSVLILMNFIILVSFLFEKRNSEGKDELN